MPRSDAELFQEKIEVSLDGRQIFYLFFGGAVIVALVFALGVMVGRRVEARRVGATADGLAAADPLAALDELSRQEDRLAFPAALAGGKRDGELAVEGPLADEVARAQREAAAERDGTEPPVPAATGGAPEAPAARSGGEAERKDPPESGAETRSPGGASGASERAPAAGEQPPGPVRPRPRSEQAQEARPAGNFVLQLSSFQSRAEADAFQAELRAAGWSSYVVQASVPGKGVWYRVRLGNYASWREAVEAKEKFERKQGKIAYVTRIGS